MRRAATWTPWEGCAAHTCSAGWQFSHGPRQPTGAPHSAEAAAARPQPRWWGPGPLQRIFAHFVIIAPLPASMLGHILHKINPHICWYTKLAELLLSRLMRKKPVDATHITPFCTS
jgi:hypothetical protein